MARYIDAEKIPFFISPVHMSQHSTSVEKIALASDIDKVPTADVVEVVRCKDCKYWQDNNDGYPHQNCKWHMDETPDENDYCSSGERKEQP